MRLASFNLQSCRPNTSFSSRTWLKRLSAFAAAKRQVAELDVDILALQEVRQARGRVARAVALAIGAPADPEHVVFLPAWRWPGRLFQALTSSREAGYGIALVSRFPIRDVERMSLPMPRRVLHHDPGGDRGYRGWYFRLPEPRVALIAAVHVGGDGLGTTPEAPGTTPEARGATPRTVVVAVTHLAARWGMNTKQLAIVERAMETYAVRHGIADSPRVLMGDLNMRAGLTEQRSTLELMARELTYPDADPKAQVDHILGRGWRVGESGAVRLAISDHRAIYVDAEPL